MIAAGSQLRRQLGLCLASVTLHLPGEHISDASFGLDNLGRARVALQTCGEGGEFWTSMLRSNTSSWTRLHPWSRRAAHQARRQARRASGRSIGRNCDWPPSLASPARPCANHRGHAPGRQRRLTWNDRRSADEMHRGRDLAWIFEAWRGQLHIGVGELDHGMEKRRR